jgi:choice-of-anchor B domain-containing protein
MSNPSALGVAAVVAVALAALPAEPLRAVAVPSRAAAAKHDQPPPEPGPEPPKQGYTPCVDGHAGDYRCSRIQLESFVPISEMTAGEGRSGNDVWGWTDPLSGREYALMGLSDGTAFVDVSDPRHPVVLGHLPTATAVTPWRGIKVYADHAFVGADRAPGHGLQVFDLRRLREVGPGEPPVSFRPDAVFAGFGSSHNIAVNEETGLIVATGSDQCSGGLYLVDVRDPRHPVQAGCFAADGYTHDAQCVVYRGPDPRHAGRELCFASNEDTLTVVDVTDRAAPVMVSRTGYPGASYAHQGWLTEDHRFFLLDDEFDEDRLGHGSRTYLWDVSDLGAPRQFASYTAATAAIDHNQYVVGDRVYQANYRAGLRILDLSRIAAGELEERGFFDFWPTDDDRGFNAAWNVYPFFRSRTLLVSGIDQGLYVLREGDGEAPLTTCEPSAERLCLNRGRFAVEGEWRNQFDGRSGRVKALPSTDLAGFLAFDDAANVELMVKVLDFGDHLPVFYGQLTNLHFALRVTDTRTGEVRQYRNTPTNCGAIDTHAFHGEGGGPHAAWLDAASAAGAPGRGIPATRPLARGKRRPATATAGSCVPSSDTLCLAGSRYAVRLSWRNQFSGASGVGRAAPLTPLVGSFSFDDARNTEVLVKLLDFGDRLLWIWGSLSNLEYELLLTDTVSGETVSASNPAGTYCGGLRENPLGR